MNFKTKSIIERIVITILFPTLSAVFLGFALSKLYPESIIDIIVASIIWICFTVCCILFFANCDGAIYDENGITLYRPCVGQKIIMWNEVEAVELRYIPKDGKNIFIYTKEFNNSYRPHDTFLSVFIVQKNDPIIFPYKEKLYDMLKEKCKNVEIKRSL